MTFFESVSTCFKQYTNFDGRASRSEYWWFFLFGLLGGWILYAVDSTQTLYYIFTLGVILPSLAVGARRLHDIGKSGWWQLVCLIPIIGFIVLVVFFTTKSEGGSNQYGPEIVLS